MKTRAYWNTGWLLVLALTLSTSALAHREAPKPEAPGGHAEPGGEAHPAAAKEHCEEHDLLEAECGICHPEIAAQLKPGQGTKVRLPAADSAALAGVELAQAQRGEIR